MTEGRWHAAVTAAARLSRGCSAAAGKVVGRLAAPFSPSARPLAVAPQGRALHVRLVWQGSYGPAVLGYDRTPGQMAEVAHDWWVLWLAGRRPRVTLS